MRPAAVNALLLGLGLSAFVSSISAVGDPTAAYAASGTGISLQQTLINQDRAGAGLPALSWSDCLAAVAVQNAERIMAQGYLSHTNGPTLALDCGVGATQGGENIAYMSGGIDDSQANTLFMNSAPHRANILGPYQFVATAWSVAPNGYAYVAEEFLGASATLVESGVQALPPARILDTRTGLGGVPAARLGPGGSLNVRVTGTGGVPAASVGAVVLNVAVTNTTNAGYLTVYPQEDPRPLAASLNWVAGQTVANEVQVAVRGSGQLTIYNAAGYTDVIFDVFGYVPTTTGSPSASGLYHPIVPARILDTRDGNGGYRGPLASRQTITFTVAGRGGVPLSGASAVVLNLFDTSAAGAPSSYFALYPAGGALPATANLNFVAGQTAGNRVTVKLGAGGQLSLYNAAGTADAIADVVGWYSDGIASTTGATFTGVTPDRVLDTRDGTGAGGPLGPGATMRVTVAGWGGVPLMSSTSPVPPTAVVLNVTVTNPSSGSYLTVYPDGAARPVTADLSFSAGQTVPDLVLVGVGANGVIDVYNAAGSTDVVADVVGWYG
ncbi:MAG TPA: CAP domain-containing protein [Acidimicrobiales bacterium]|nr:CAP domain-containing protein [Acidimicrobiales bacterium]